MSPINQWKRIVACPSTGRPLLLQNTTKCILTNDEGLNKLVVWCLYGVPRRGRKRPEIERGLQIWQKLSKSQRNPFACFLQLMSLKGLVSSFIKIVMIINRDS